MWLYVEPLYVNRLSKSFPEWGWGCGVLSLSLVCRTHLRNLGPHRASLTLTMFRRALSCELKAGAKNYFWVMT